MWEPKLWELLEEWFQMEKDYEEVEDEWFDRCESQEKRVLDNLFDNSGGWHYEYYEYPSTVV